MIVIIIGKRKKKKAEVFKCLSVLMLSDGVHQFISTMAQIRDQSNKQVLRI